MVDRVAAPWSRVAAATSAVAVGWFALSWLVAGPLARQVASREPLPLLGLPLPAFGPATPEELVARTLTVLGLLVVLGAAAAARWPGGARRFLLAPAAPLDLAVLRITLFAFLLILPRVPEAVRLSGFPPELRQPPLGMPWLLDVVPTSPATVRPAAALFLLACVFGLLGLWTRTATIVAAVLGLYVLGIPQYYGKVSHYHHLWWVLVVLAASPCGRALSLDALRRGWRRPREAVPRDVRSVAFGLPIRIVWLLLALAYLFPGLWKFASAGWEWAFSDNLRFILYEHWARLEGFEPILPIDRSPLTEIAGVATIVFEIGFILLLFSPVLRPWLAGIGLAFHNANFLFLRLGFFSLQILYVTFVPWQRFATWLGSRVATLAVQVVPGTRAERLVAAADAGDPFGLLAVRPAADGTDDAGVLLVEEHRTGRAALRAVLARSPLLWPVWLVTLVVSDRRVSAWLGEAAASGPDDPVGPDDAARDRRNVRVTSSVGALLLAGVLVTGFTATSAAWPFAVYPTFAGIHSSTIARLSLEVTTPDGETRVHGSPELRDLVTWEKYDGMVRPIVRAGDDPPRDQVAALLEVLRDEGLALPAGGEVTLLRDVEQLTAEGGEVVERTTLVTLSIDELLGS